ncbi:putative gustatory receptor 59f [Anopheles aquasalis]|uniref:putative gustatory receptor 59f n=1 Tax=Anopheles aquasalis TaxID=42839 RepID=UPI00215A490A|nr:putative gustatory receptor 59f [Anopheles aquasalis]
MDHIGSLPLTIVYVVPYTVSFMILLQYYSVFVHLWSCLRKLNIKLTPIVQGYGYLPYTGESVTFLNLTRNGKDDPMSPQQEVIEKLRMVHLKAMNVAGNVNTNFGLVIILIVVAVFASINVELLELYQYIKNGRIGPGHIVLKFLYTCFKFFFYYLIAHPNRMIQSENEQTLILLYSIRKTACSDETNSAIEHYVSQISNLRNVHQACGMIDLDMKLISNVSASL